MFRSISRKRQLRSQALAQTPVTKVECNPKQLMPRQRGYSRAMSPYVWEKSQNSRLRSRSSDSSRLTRNQNRLNGSCAKPECCNRCRGRLRTKNMRTSKATAVHDDCELPVERVKPQLNKCQKCKLEKCSCNTKNESKVKKKSDSKCDHCMKKQSNFSDVKKFTIKGVLIATKN